MLILQRRLFLTWQEKYVTEGKWESFIGSYFRNVRQDSLMKFLRCQFVPSKPDREPFSELINQLWPLSGKGRKNLLWPHATNYCLHISPWNFNTFVFQGVDKMALNPKNGKNIKDKSDTSLFSHIRFHAGLNVWILQYNLTFNTFSFWPHMNRSILERISSEMRMGWIRSAKFNICSSRN